MTLHELGFNVTQEKFRKDHNLDSFGLARVISEHKDRYTLKTTDKEYDAELIGKLRFAAENRCDLPAVGDWVAFTEYDKNKALIHSVYPRYSVIKRQAVSKAAEVQIIATNIDFCFIVQSVNRDYSINRLERYLAICNVSKVEPIVLLSKIDLIEEQALNDLLVELKERIKGVPIYCVSNLTNDGLAKIKGLVEKGKTYCLLGSSGVGKSTLLNALSGKELMITGEINEGIDRGRHITTHRELIVLDDGGIFIDNPGMREIGLTESSGGLEITFDEIIQLASECKFNDCSHENEAGCAIQEALQNDEIDAKAFYNFKKMRKESAFFESSVEEKKKKDKNFGKMIKGIKKQRKENKY